MKYVFILVLLLIAGAGGLMGAAVVVRWVHNMTESPRIMPGRARLHHARRAPCRAAARSSTPRSSASWPPSMPNPVKPTEASVAAGRARYETFCTPCHGAEAKGGVTGPVATKFIPPPDLTNARFPEGADGRLLAQLHHGRAAPSCPSYGEALSSQEAWDIVNYLRTLAAR